MSVLSAFTNQLLNLMGNLCDMYPNDPDLSFTKTSIQLMKKSNPRKLQEIFEEYVAIHEKAIMEKNGDFFISCRIWSFDCNFWIVCVYSLPVQLYLHFYCFCV